MRALLIRVVLALYPAQIRDRYGDEITELLAASPTAARDLADTAWCALRDRLARPAAMTPAGVGIAALTLLRLLLTPIGLSLAWVCCLLPLNVLGGTLVDMLAPGTDLHQVMPVLLSLAALPVGWLAYRLGRGAGWAGRVGGTAWLVVPVTLGVTVAALATLPDPWPGDLYGGHPTGSGAAVLCWAVGVALLGLAVRSLRRRGRLPAARLVALLGGFAVLELATVVYVVLAVGVQRAPLAYAPLWYPSVLTGVDLGLVDGDRWMLGDAAKLLPGILTICTVYTFALVSAVTSDRPRAAALSA